jgi:hypothetical protein
MTEVLKLILMLSFAAISLAALFVFIIATSKVGLGGVLPFTNVSKGARIVAAPYRRRLLYLIIGAVLVCALLAAIELLSA